MSDDSEELLTGREGNEAAQGWTEMKSADPIPKEPEGLDLANDPAVKHLSRPSAEQEPPVEREYYGRDGEPTPERESVSAEQAGRDLASIRAAERAERERQSNADLDEALRAHEAGQPAAEQSPEAPQPDQPQLSADELQIEGMDDDAKRAFAEAKFAEADQILEEALKSPFVREKLESEFNAVRTQAAAVVQAAKIHYDAAISQLGQEIGIVTAALIPEIAGMSPEQARGALAMIGRTNPQRLEQITAFANKIQGAANIAQQQAHAQQQQQSHAAEMQQRQAAEAFQQYAAAEDAKALLNETPERLSAIRNVIYSDAQAAGISKEQLHGIYNSVPAMRHSFVQGLLADGAKYRLAQRGVTQARSNPIPQVQRPGVSSGAPSDNSEYASLERSFRGKDLSAKQAADLLIAHRARR